MALQRLLEHGIPEQIAGLQSQSLTGASEEHYAAFRNAG